MTVFKLTYSSERAPKPAWILAALICATGIGILSYGIICPPENRIAVPAKAGVILRLMDASQAIENDTTLSDAQRTRKLITMVSAARSQGALPWPGMSEPTNGERSLAVLLTHEANREAVGSAAAEDFTRYLKSTYPRFDVKWWANLAERASSATTTSSTFLQAEKGLKSE